MKHFNRDRFVGRSWIAVLLSLFFFTAAATAQECGQCFPDIDICSIFPDYCAVPPPPPPQAEQSIGRSVLHAGESLQPNTYMPSPGGLYRLSMQADGNLVLYRNSDQAVIWTTWTMGVPGLRAELQSDGNLVLYNSNNAAYWASYTNEAANAMLALQDDGNLVIYGEQALWESGTSYGGCYVGLPYDYSPIPGNPLGELRAGQVLGGNNRILSSNGCYELVMQPDFNLVLYRRTDHAALWASWSLYHGPGYQSATLQTDGNFVVYRTTFPLSGPRQPGDVALWQSGTVTSAGAVLKLKDDGNAVVYQRPAAIWANGVRYTYGSDGNSWSVPNFCIEFTYVVGQGWNRPGFCN